ncbi:hypothetical protein TSA6c_16850 [Azospirillum sp. TSA6c]|uniref:DNA methyltransferase n=1 Tax=Azospirillum sp. TSA6c TaxID=709813 RepID=UPI000D608127|nr:DNA methyltransferase [Azospirillum sp. TSA6c]PWC48107.1 hypothetical protein TSA6c_16850 [Azospirillum sp. TSA6c]
MYNVFTGDVLDVLPTIPDASVDAVLCDPPYGLSDHRHRDVIACLTAWLAGQPYRPRKRGFMGRGWDGWVPGPECWSEVLRALRPGGHALVFAGTRSMDLMVVALRLAGFEIRECIRSLNGSDHYPAWVYGGGLAKHEAQIRPGWEPVIIARKPLDGTLAGNIAKHGTGGLNIEGCRIARGGDKGQHPINVIHDGSDEVAAEFAALPDTSRPCEKRSKGEDDRRPGGTGVVYSGGWGERRRNQIESHYDDAGTAARFFYAAKASGRDRWLYCRICGTAHPKREIGAHEHGRDDAEHIVMHPTVKPTSLTEYLARLVMPIGVNRPRRILVPFAGSGSEMVGALRAGWEEVIGIEMDPDYVAIAAGRCEVAKVEPLPLKKAGKSKRKADTTPATAPETPVAPDLFSTAAE